MGAWLVMGISAWATLLLNGPMMPATSASPTSAVTFWAPTAGSWMPLGPTSSLGSKTRVYPLMVCLALASMTARFAPSSAGLPLLASFPDTGRSVAILIVVEPVLGVLLPVPVLVPAPHATSIIANMGIHSVSAKIRNQLLFMM